jgi:hypothetical protein
MADTQRTNTDLLSNLFQDGQSDGSITPQDVRDLIVSMVQSHGGCRWSSAAATTIASSTAYVKAAGTTTLLTAAAKNFTMPANNRLMYGGTPTINAFAIAAVSIKTASAGTVEISAQLAENGSVLAETENVVYAVTAVKNYSLTVMGQFVLATNDYVELFVANNTNTDNLQVDYGTMFVHGVHI